jgi:hypothetical protein
MYRFGLLAALLLAAAAAGSAVCTEESGSGYSWRVSLVPTAACRPMFCAALSPEVLGPLPPVIGDRALPGMGYSVMITLEGRHCVDLIVRIYVEDGYVVSSDPSIRVTRVRNYKLAEIDRHWYGYETIVIGPGWWVFYQPHGPCETMSIRASSIYVTPNRTGPLRITVETIEISWDGSTRTYIRTYVCRITDDIEYSISTRTPAPAPLTGTPFNITVHVLLDGAPYFHYMYGFGEGSRLAMPSCVPARIGSARTSQLAISGDFWGSFGLANMPLRPVNVRYIYSKPRLELADPWRGLVRVRADGPVAGFAFYAQRGGTWVKIGEARGSCILINASKMFPWDPILALPLVEQELTARPGDAVTLWRPQTALLFKTWADVVGYPKGARSELKIVGTC